MKSLKNSGYFYAISSAILFGVSTPVAKFLVGQIDPWLLAGLFYLGAGVGLYLILLLRKKFAHKSSQDSILLHTDWKWLLGATLSGGIIAPVLLMLALIKTPATTTSLLLNFEGVFTAVIAWIIFREHTDIKLIFGVVLIILGGVILGWHAPSQTHHILGPLLVAGACLAWAIDNNLTRKISAANPIKIVAIKSTVAGVTNTILAFILGAILPKNFYIITTSIGVGFIAYGLSLIFFILSLRTIGTARTSAYFSLAPFVGAFCAILFLGEPLSWQLILASLLMATGIYIHLSEYHEHPHQHELLTHHHQHSHDEHHQHEHLATDPPGEPHSHIHTHEALWHSHFHYPDIHHHHRH